MCALSTPAPHPLAELLIARYRADHLHGTVLEVGAGSGRNTRALEAAGIPVHATSDDELYTQLSAARATFVAALSSHAYLHGTTAKVRAGLAELRRVLVPGAPVFLTLGSYNDPRFGFGTAYDERTYAPGDGDEAGIPHAYFDRDAIDDVLRGFTIDSAEEVDATAIVGRWAHPGLDPAAERIVHWFITARTA